MYLAHIKFWDAGDVVDVTAWTEAKFVHRLITPPQWLWSGINDN